MAHIIGWISDHLLPCVYKQLFGISCPCCGFQRSVIALLEGNLVKSFMLYPALLPSLVSLIPLVAVKRDKRRRYMLRMASFDVLIAMVGCILKNTGLLPD